MVQTGFSRLLGSRMERLLRKTTRNRPLAFSSGAGAAFLLQSSTAVVLMVGGFTASSMMTLTAALATVLGAEFGASLAAFLLNLDVQALALPLVLLGFVFFKNSDSRSWKHAGRITIGIGLVLLSLDLIGDTTSMLGHSDIMALIINRVETDSALAITLMAILTWLIHSTLASVLLIAQFVSDDAISLNAGLFMLLGANLGGAMPALIAGWSLNRKGRQVVIGNLIFRATAMVLGLLILTLTAGLLTDYLPSGSLGIVIAHSLLNLVNGVVLMLFLPLLLLLVLLLLLLSPSRLFFASRYFVIVKVLEKVIFLRESLLFLLLCLFLGEGDVVFVSSSVVGFGVIFERHGVVSLFLRTLGRA
jgi:phosphate:Na+ symporter